MKSSTKHYGEVRVYVAAYGSDDDALVMRSDSLDGMHEYVEVRRVGKGSEEESESIGWFHIPDLLRAIEVVHRAEIYSSKDES